jgi:single-stranded DNA-binding protein
MNNISIIGRLGRDAERKNHGDRAVLSMSVAVDDRTGKEKRADWFRVDLWGSQKRIDAIERFFQKGDVFGFRGRMKSRESDRDGRKITYWSLSAEDFFFTGGGQRKQEAKREPSGRYGDKATGFKDDIDTDDVPF